MLTNIKPFEPYFLGKSRKLVVPISERIEVVRLLSGGDFVDEWRNPQVYDFFFSGLEDFSDDDEKCDDDDFVPYAEFSLDLLKPDCDSWISREEFQNPAGISHRSMYCLILEGGVLYKKFDFSFSLFCSRAAFCYSSDAARRIRDTPRILIERLDSIINQSWSW